MGINEALDKARDMEMDLIEIVSNSEPPVCKIISWSKFKYEYSKKQKGQKQHSSQMKEMWFKPLTDVGDLNHKMKKVLAFIEDKHKVKLTIKSNRKTARLDKRHYFDLLTRILSDLQEVAETETPPKLEGRNVYAIIKPKK
jgi:translation initiation factor IF-3